MTDPQRSPKSGESRYLHHLARGAAVNSLGLIGKVLDPVFLLVVTWLFGPAIVGLYLLALFLIEVAATLATAGLVDATTVFGSRMSTCDDHERETSEDVHRMLGVACGIAMAASLGTVAVVYLGADLLVSTLYPTMPELAPAIKLFAWSIPPLAIARLSVAGTKARMRMEYDALIFGLARPLLVLALGVLAWWLGAGLQGLIGAYVLAHAVLALFGIAALSRHFQLGRVLKSIGQYDGVRELLAFAIPQNLNMTVNRYLARIDVIMLGALGHQAPELAFYGTAALIAGNLRQVRLVFGTAMMPVATRHHRDGDRAALQDTLTRLTRWTASIVIPIALVLVIVRGDILRLFHETYTGDSTFMVLLIGGALFGCVTGLAGNTLVSTGHTAWTLFNSVLVAVVNTGLNLWLIPRFGLMGAALATVVAIVVVSLLQMAELRTLEGVSIVWRRVTQPMAGLAAGALALGLVWDPAHLPTLAIRLLAATLTPVALLGLMLVLRHEELMGLVRRQLRQNRVA
jgi:O-antigen/teichoic acid export membrane protein